MEKQFFRRRFKTFAKAPNTGAFIIYLFEL